MIQLVHLGRRCLALFGRRWWHIHGRLLTAYHDAVAAAYWQHAKSIDDRQLLADIAASLGLERAAFLAALDDPAYEREVDDDIAFAHSNGMTGVPALVLAEKYLVMGAQPYPVLEQVVRQCEDEAGL